MTVPYTFANQTGNIPLSQLDDNFTALSVAVPNFANIAGSVSNIAQPNIRSLGTLTSLVSSGNITSSANISGSYILGNGSQLTGITANYNNSNVIALLSSFGSNTITTTGNITAQNFIGTIVGNISNAVFATTAGTVTTAAQPNITSVGTLTSLAVTGNITGGNLISSGNIATLSSVKRVILVANTAPTSGDGAVGDIWYQTY
jgi:hypothetical protein